MNQKTLFLHTTLETFGVFVFPVLLLSFGVVSLSHRHWLILAVVLVIGTIMIKEKWSLKKVGLRTDNLQTSLFPYAVFTGVGLLGVGSLALLMERKPVTDLLTAPHFAYGFLLISAVQELGFRGFLMPRLQSLFSSPFVIISINALIFAFMHIIFPEPVRFLPLGLITGYVFAAMYYFYPNLYLITISHATLNYFAVMFCFFSFQTSC